jgi:hypothetical protein
VKERKQFGQPIAAFQNTQFRIADMATDLEAARALLYLAAAKVTAGAPDKTRFAAMAKRLASDLVRPSSMPRCNCLADTVICATIRLNGSGATCACTVSLRAQTR